MGRYRPTTVTVMDNVQLAYDTLTVTEGETLVIHRMWSDDDAYLWQYETPEAYADAITHNGTISRAVWLYVLNEPDTSIHRLPILLNWLCDVGDILAERGYHAILGNIGSATVQPETIEAGVFDRYLRKLGEWSETGQHYGGWHEYTGILLPNGAGYWRPGKLNEDSHDAIQIEHWPEIDSDDILAVRYGVLYDAQLNVPPEPDHYWHLLRSEWFNLRAEKIGATRHKIVCTEFGWDRMPDMTAGDNHIYRQLELRYGAHDHFELRGMRTLKNVWANYFPDWSFDRAAYEQLMWAERNYPDNYIGLDCFAWTFDGHLDKEQNWQALGYNMGDMPELQSLLLQTPPDPEPIPEPIIPTMPAWMAIALGIVGAVIMGVLIYSLFVAPRFIASVMEGNQMEELLNQLFAIPAIAPIAFSGAIILYLVEVGKRLKVRFVPEDRLEWFTPQFMVMVWVVFFMGAFAITEQYAYDNAFKDMAGLVTQLISVLGPYVLGILGTQVVVAVSHNRIRKIDIPGFDQ